MRAWRTFSIVTALCFLTMAAARSQEIFDAVRAGDAAAVRALLERSPEALTARDGGGNTPLHIAAASGNVELILALIEKGAPLELQNARIKTPLHLAAMNDRTEAVTALLRKGAAIEARDDYQRTALILCARERGQAATGRVLIEAGADVNAVDKFGSSALGLAAWRGKQEFVDLLLGHGARLPEAPAERRQLIAEAASHGLTGLFQRLADRIPDLKDAAEGGVLLNSAASGGSAEIVSALLAKGCDPARADRFGWTPLHYAARDGRTEAARMLIERGAPLDARALMGQTAYNVAREREMTATAALLAERGADTAAIRFPVLEGDYLGQPPPKDQAELFGLGIISSIWGLHSTAVFSPDGNEVYWAPMMAFPGEVYSRGGLQMMKRVNGRWTAPVWAPFSGPRGEDDVPFFSADGRRLYFISQRPLPGESQPGSEKIWLANRTAAGWSEPRPLDPAVNAHPMHWQFSLDRNGNLYFAGQGTDSHGLDDIYRARFSGGAYEPPVNLGAPVNSAAGENSPFIAPDGSYLLFSRQYDIWASFRDAAGAWSEPVRLGPEINSPSIELCPMVTADGKYIFFLSQRDGESHAYWVRADVIEKARPGRAPTAAELVDRCARAMGGAEAIRGLKTLRFHSIYPDHGDTPILFEIMRPNRSRSPRADLVFDGTRACFINGRDGKPGPQMVPAEELVDFEVEIGWFFPAFFDYPAEYAGAETVEGREAHKLRVALPRGARMTYFLDAATDLVVRITAEFTLGGKEYTFDRALSDHRPVNGLVFPHCFTYTGRTGVQTGRIEKIELNVPLAEDAFRIPKEPAGGDHAVTFYSGRDGNKEVYILYPGRKEPVNLTRHPAQDLCPAASPVGGRIAFLSDRDGNMEIYSMAVDGSDVRRLTASPENEEHPEFTPDGRSILFVKDYEQRTEIWIMAADGADPRRLTNNAARDERPFMSPDGSKIVFMSSRDGNYEIYTMAADGSGQTRLTNTPEWEIFPAWSPDGRQIAYSQKFRADGRMQGMIRVMSADGGGDQAVTAVETRDENAMWSPDGRYILFQSVRDGNFEVYRIDADGGHPVRLTDDPAWDGWAAFVPVQKGRQGSH
ncbi:MAG TPA: ankyrin repeat domain-containing protein [Acidobacteriota bacterium]|nr:ankyrin repeat domain-containing protein [Acidobacteriota bacterium]HNU02112.1 ankyrin repeat domain-containing protein [Acidobacteriota bacterium]